MNISYRIILVLCVVSGIVCAQRAEYSSYALLKDVDVPEYDEWRFNFSIESYTFENFTPGYSWHESVYTATVDFGFWTFRWADLSVGGKLPFYFWYAKDKLENDNKGIQGAALKTTGFMDPELFADLKFDLPFSNHISALLHGSITLPGVVQKAENGGAGVGETRGEIMGGIVIEYKRFIFKTLGGVEVGSEIGDTPAVYYNYRTPAIFVPQVAPWENTVVDKYYIDLVFCASATVGFGLEYFYRGSYFNQGQWKQAYDTPIYGTIDDIGIFSIKLIFATTAGGFYSTEKGTLFTIGVGFGGVGTDPELNPDAYYSLALSKYF